MPTTKEEIQKKRQKRLNWLIVTLLVLAVIVLSAPTTHYYDLSDIEIDQPSPRDFRADSDYRILDEIKTETRREEQLAQIKPRFIKLKQREQAVIDGIEQEIEAIRSGEREAVVDTASVSGQQWQELHQAAVQIARFLLKQGIILDKTVFELFEFQSTGELVELADKDPRVEIRQREVSLEEFEHQVVGLDHLSVWADDVLNGLYSDFEHNNLVKELLERNIEPNLVFEEDRFLNRIEEVKDEVGPFYINIQEGEVILSAGEIVSEDVYVLLRRMNRAEVKFRIFGGITRLGIVLLGMGFIFIYLREYRPDFFEKYNLLAVIAIIIAGLVAAARILQIMQPHLPSGIEYGFPYTAAIILLAILISPQMALLISLFLSLLAVSFFGFGFELFALYLLGGLAGLFSVKDIDRRTELMRSGAIVAAVQIYAVFLFYIIRTGNVLELELGVKLAWAAFNGAILVPFVVVGILPFLENGFNITTNFKLQELADLNHPLLQKLFIKAPGSYQHSIMLSNLCEQGAQAIGANTLLVRAGTYFHDIGKAEMPEYFVENQGEGNPHDELKPTLSASILKTHVKKGVELAEENNLPREIIDMIKQHHGTTKIQYFYHRALETEEEVNEEEFRYPGPIPQFKEAAILMVGDSVEAAARTIENPTHKKIREVVQSVVYDKFKQGQLNQCELTLKDLDTIVETFTRVLASIHHKRISYPDDEENGHPGEKQPSEKK